jgi:hypothetical protein
MPGGGTSTNSEGSMGSYDMSFRDRYGNSLSGRLSGGGYSFEKSRKKTTLKLSVRVGEGEYERVEFRNISLVRGEDQGLEIEVIPRNPPSKWKAVLSNGAVVELRGVCEMPNEGKKWWGADGTILEYPPLYTTSSSLRSKGRKKRYQMTWSIFYPIEEGMVGPGDTKFDIEDCSFVRREGSNQGYRDTTRWQYAQIMEFAESRREASVKIEVKVGDGEYERVEFKNMSLVPGEDRGFKIVMEKKE